MNKIKVLDLFAGCGGITCGLTKAGFDIICSIDIWKVACDTLKKNFKHIVLCKDLREYSPEKLSEEEKIKEIDMITGGFPCQSYSIAGKRDVNDPRGMLYLEFIKYVKYFKPTYFLIENVVGIISMNDKNGNKIVDNIMNAFVDEYECKYFKVNASDFNVPQNRKRIIFVGVRKELHLSVREPEKVTGKHIPIKNILIDKKDIEKKTYLSERAILGIKKKKERMKKEGKGFGAQFLNMDKPCYTIPARYWKDGYDALVKYSETEIRRLTITEIKRVQTFDDNYELCGNKKEQIMQLGNAVPVNLAYNLGLHIKKMITKL
jgi:DNA (cytosine-5)-methyltransferase 1